MTAVVRRRFRTPHPGKIEVYEDGVLSRTLDATTLPDAVRYAPTARGEAPVVRVLTTRADGRVHVREFGVDGALLRSSTHLAGDGG